MSETTLGPIPYQAGTLSAANVQYGGFCRMTDKIFFTIYRQTTPMYVFAQILTVDDLKASNATLSQLRVQRIMEIPSNSLYTAAFDCVRLSDNYVIVFGKQSASVATVEIRIFWINPVTDSTGHQYAIHQVGQPIMISDIVPGTSTIGSRPFILNSIVDNVCIFEYQQSTVAATPAIAYTRVLQRLQFTPDPADPSKGTSVIKTIATIGSYSASVAFCVPSFAKQPTGNRWTAMWSYNPNNTTTYAAIIGSFDPASDANVTLTNVTGAQGVARAITTANYNTVYMPRSDTTGIIFNGASVDYDTITNGACTGTKKQVADTLQVGTANWPVMGWWTDPNHFILLTTNNSYLSCYPVTHSWKFFSSVFIPLIRVCTYTNDSNIAVTYGTAVAISQFNATNTPAADSANMYIYPYKTEIYGGDTMVFYGYDTTAARPPRWLIKTVSLV